MIKKRKTIKIWVIITFLVQSGYTTAHLTTEELEIVLSHENYQLDQEANTRVIVAVEDLPVIDVDNDEVTFFDQPFYNEYDNQIESFESAKISYFEQKLRAWGIMLLLTYIETKEIVIHKYDTVKRMIQHLLFQCNI